MHINSLFFIFYRLGYSVPVSLFNFELPKLVDEEEDEDDDDLDLDDDDFEATNDETAMVVKVTSNAKGEATVTPTTSTYVALPSGMTALPLGTIVTRADTTVDLSAATSAAASTASLVTSSSTKQAILSSASKVMLAKTST